jgi:hypothetical protein
MTQGATHYHTTAVNPVWNSGLVETTQIGVHQFYRFPNSSERAYYQEALARRRGSGRGHRAVQDALIPQADAAALETVEDGIADPAVAEEADTPIATEAPVAAGEVAT